MGFLDNLFNMADKREIKAFSKVADKIDAMEPKFEAMTNKELKNIKVLMNLVESIISLEKLNLNFYEDNRDYHNIVEILENIAIKLNKYKDINIIFNFFIYLPPLYLVLIIILIL